MGEICGHPEYFPCHLPKLSSWTGVVCSRIISNEDSTCPGRIVAVNLVVSLSAETRHK